ncbi:peroxiredoxin [Candidatus Bathyarchaeota archaeon]|nr:peroxiredoxin [Candidatus Bathyarchaeota archaeon]
MEEKNVYSLPLIGEKAPDFEAFTTQGVLKLSDFEGSWLVLFSHPADFTPVCTTEFIAFANIYEELKKRNTELLGLSVDSVSSHIAWVRNVEEKMGVKLPFPIIADLNKEVSVKFGMIHPAQSKTETIRCVFIIDSESKIRTILYYPLTTGRNMDEILRIIDALQMADKNKVATPANWRPGDPVVVPPPTTTEQADARVKEGYDCKDWYLCFKKL